MAHRITAALAGTVLAGTGLAVAGPAGAAAAATGCAAGTLPAAVQGRPAQLQPGAAAGDYIWHNDTGWHLAVTHPGDARVVFTGRVTADAPITYTPVRDERDDVIWRSSDGRTLVFRFVNYGGVDGMDFRTGCADRVDVSLQMSGRELSPARIWLGAHGIHPLSDPFTIERR